MSYVNPALMRLSTKKLSKKKIKEHLKEHYDTLEMFLKGVGNDKWHLIVNGPAGSGKTEITKEVLSKHKHILKVSGTLSAVRLYVFLHQMRKKGHVLIIDDTDKILEDVECLEVLKAALGKDGEIDWSKYSQALAKENVPKKFTYNGRMVIITNKSFKTQTDTTMTRMQEAQLPVLSRCQYFRAGLPNIEWQIEAIKYYQGLNKIHCFQDNKGKMVISKNIQNKLIKYIEDNSDNLREISFRLVSNLYDLYVENPRNWQMMANASQWH